MRPLLWACVMGKKVGPDIRETFELVVGGPRGDDWHVCWQKKKGDIRETSEIDLVAKGDDWHVCWQKKKGDIRKSFDLEVGGQRR